VEIPPSPKSHVHEVGVFRDESMNCTVSGIVPELAFDMNDATGIFAKTGLMRNTTVTRTRNNQNAGFVFMLNRPILFFLGM